MFFIVFFFFKQKTAYEILRSDWSSDVCSSDLLFPFPGILAGRVLDTDTRDQWRCSDSCPGTFHCRAGDSLGSGAHHSSSTSLPGGHQVGPESDRDSRTGPCPSAGIPVAQSQTRSKNRSWPEPVDLLSCADFSRSLHRTGGQSNPIALGIGTIRLSRARLDGRNAHRSGRRGRTPGPVVLSVAPQS